MKEKGKKIDVPDIKETIEEKDDLQGYPGYPSSEDIYNKFQKGKNIDPEDLSKNIEPKESDNTDRGNEKDFVDDETGGGLDIPGSELDDKQEMIGSEDEENNYYSLGGDDHNDLDEDKADS
jgi:hypothetical protein